MYHSWTGLFNNVWKDNQGRRTVKMRCSQHRRSSAWWFMQAWLITLHKSKEASLGMLFFCFILRATYSLILFNRNQFFDKTNLSKFAHHEIFTPLHQPGDSCHYFILQERPYLFLHLPDNHRTGFTNHHDKRYQKGSRENLWHLRNACCGEFLEVWDSRLIDFDKKYCLVPSEFSLGSYLYFFGLRQTLSHWVIRIYLRWPWSGWLRGRSTGSPDFYRIRIRFRAVIVVEYIRTSTMDFKGQPYFSASS